MKYLFLVLRGSELLTGVVPYTDLRAEAQVKMSFLISHSDLSMSMSMTSLYIQYNIVIFRLLYCIHLTVHRYC